MSETLCWKCAIPGTRGCRWDAELLPVDGWTAEPTTTDGFETFHVIHCPLFVQEERRKVKPQKLTEPIKQFFEPTERKELLTDKKLELYDRMGLSLFEISEMTGIRTGIIYKRRQKLRRCRDEEC